jgi:Holliday junction resolvasome RuvABC endonuclease subunit
MIILALDISSKSTGYAVLQDDLPIADGYGLICPSPKFTIGAKLVYFQNEVVALITKFKPDVIVTEQIFRGPNTATFKVLSQFSGVALKTIFEQIGREPEMMLAVEARSCLGVRYKKEEAFEDLTSKFNLQHFDNFEQHNDIVDAFALAFAIVEIRKGNYAKPVRSPRSRKKRKPTGRKKGVSQNRSSKSPRSKSRRRKGRGDV